MESKIMPIFKEARKDVPLSAGQYLLHTFVKIVGKIIKISVTQYLKNQSFGYITELISR